MREKQPPFKLLPPAASLTPTQNKALAFIFDYIEREKTPPSLREICEFMGYKAIGSVQDLVKALEKKGYLEKRLPATATAKKSARYLRLTRKAQNIFALPGQAWRIPCLGQVPAGTPIEALEDSLGELQLSPDLSPGLVKMGEADHLFGLRATGMSMQDAGIFDRDWLVVQKTSLANVGDIVIAQTPEYEATCKRLAFSGEKKEYYLKAENPAFEDIWGAFEIVGRVVGVQRYFA